MGRNTLDLVEEAGTLVEVLRNVISRQSEGSKNLGNGPCRMDDTVIPQSHTRSPMRDVTVSQFEIVCRVALRTSRWRLEHGFVYLHIFYVM